MGKQRNLSDAEIAIVVTVASMQEYEELTKRLFFENHNVNHFKSLVVMDRVKASMAVSLPKG